MPFELLVALRYLTARRKQAFISVISSISVLGVVVGVMALMVALGLMTGLQREIRSRILGATAHISVFKSRNDTFENYRQVVEAVRKAPRVQGAAPAPYGQGDRASLVEVKIDDMYAVRQAAAAILDTVGDGYLTTDWIQMNQSLFSALWLEKTAIGITIGLIVMVAALNIVATLILMVMEKHKDIAILVSMGASRRSITRIFMLQGTVIGALGTLAGAVLGWGACRVLDHYKLIRVPVDVYQISYVPFTLLASDAALVVVGAVLICFLATIHPARGAARLDPAEALRYE